MPTIRELRARSEALFTTLLELEHPTGRRAATGRATTSDRTGRMRSFSWFDPDDAAAATRLGAELALAAGGGRTSEDGLAAALDLAEARLADEPPALVRQALAMFVTHHRPARRLRKPRSVVARPQAFVRSRVGTTLRGARARSTGSAAEAALDEWREDALLNEHHEHWHEVYPFSGLFPSDWLRWATETDPAAIAALLQALEPRPAGAWRAFVDAGPPAAVADAFIDRARALPDFGAFLAGLDATAYGALFRLNDRQGELFVYMHQQMLARYDAERLSHGRPRVQALEPPYTAVPGDGYDPAPLPGYLPRPVGRALPAASAQALAALDAEITDAIASGALLGAGPQDVPLDRDTVGEAIEAAEARLRVPLRAGRYRGMHNIGHGRIAAISAVAGDPRGAVMNDPAAAIRDPIFWRWHKRIDDLASSWQETQAPYAFDDLPPVVLRDALDDGAPAEPWSSPDILLVARDGGTERSTARSRIRAAVSGRNRDIAIADGPVRNQPGYRFTSELTTMVRTRPIGASTARYLTHAPFGYAVRITNPSGSAAAVTVRTFVAPASLADDRRSWIELDKVSHTVAARTTSVLYRSDVDLSVVKRPAETDPSQVEPAGTDPDDESYCECGWPWTLALPRGTTDGMPFRMIVLCTDGALDQVPAPGHCGSMSYCGAVDRYPDTRDMGYPFSRPFAAPIADTVLALSAAAGRSFTIRHTG
jgi:hypothetical protein